MIEEYAFSFSYNGSDSQKLCMNINCVDNQKQGATFKSNSNVEITGNHINSLRMSSACKRVSALDLLIQTLDRMPEGRTILMKLLYYDDVTPAEYEPPLFRSCSEEEANNPWMNKPLKMAVGNVNIKHFVFALKVKSILEYQDENNGMGDTESKALYPRSDMHPAGSVRSEQGNAQGQSSRESGVPSLKKTSMVEDPILQKLKKPEST